MAKKKYNFFIEKILVSAFISLLTTFVSEAKAQMTPDLTLPNNTTIKLDKKIITIEGGTKVGNNLFHSFKDFSIPTGTSVQFNNAHDIQNIITRITGGSASNIDGLISANGTANLFLINPSGILFGPNAHLDIGGSFFATTADAIEFANGSEFNATEPQAPLLTVNIPIGLRFNGKSGSITVQGLGQGLTAPNAVYAPTILNNNSPRLSVSEKQTLALLGNKIILDGANLTSQGGNIELSSINSGSVNLISASNDWSFKYEKVSNFEDINISKQSLINASGNPGGFVQARGANINLQDGSIIIIQNLGNTSSGNINISASDSLVVKGTSPDGNISSSIRTESLNTGKGGDIRISTQKLVLQDGARINSTAYSDALGGNVIIDASKTIDFLPNKFANPFRRGDIISTMGAVTVSRGNAGYVHVSTERLYITDGGAIASSTFGSGNGNIVTINANSIEITGLKPERTAPSNIGSATFSSGNAGAVNINTSTLKLKDGGIVNSASLASGDAGSVSINAQELIEVSGPNSFISSSVNTANEIVKKIFNLPSVPSGSSGNVAITTEVLNVNQGGQISVGNEGTGNAGELTINANTVQVKTGRVNATTAIEQGGNISLKSQNLQLKNGILSATAGTNGNGGNITINTDILAASNNSNITANASEGRGGNIEINARGLFLSPDSRITASSERGINGTVQINADTYLNEVPATPETIKDKPEITSVCQGRTSGNSEFFLTGTGGLPPSPEELPDTESTWQEDSAKKISNLESSLEDTTEIIEAQGWQQNSDGSITLTAEANIVNPDATKSANSCKSDASVKQVSQNNE